MLLTAIIIVHSFALGWLCCYLVNRKECTLCKNKRLQHNEWVRTSYLSRDWDRPRKDE